MKDGVYFSGSCHFLCTLFSLTFCLWPPWLPATPHAASEKTLHHIHVLCNLLVVLLLHPPVSIRLPFFMTSALVIPSSITSISVFSSVHIKFSSPPLLSVLAYLLPPLPLFLPPGMWKHLLPVACCVDVKACVWAQEHKVLVRIHGCVQSYILAFQWKMVIRQPIKSLMARATLTKQKKEIRCSATENKPNKLSPKYGFTAEFCISICCSAFELLWRGSSENVKSFSLRGQVEVSNHPCSL